MPPDRHVPDRALRTSSWYMGLNCAPAIIHSLDHHAVDSTFWLISSTILREREHPGVVSGASPFSLFHFHQPRRTRWLFRVPPCHSKALFIYKHPCTPLWDSNPVPTAQQSVSLTTVLNS
ncbi:hypothetical protein TNCV_1408901 [Trichonephila clavipes]|uniref:Uncharacterized protein n=1 Tax=Trichonephila clavipes TaxID=2585209 RepID=A0A8X6R6F8_TRICX|nr:hypothetical protein TNCV_1408901 [Trichonephila clavipes]